jgi:hypothetical protein
MTSLASALSVLLGAIPRIIGFLIIFLIGWLIASALYRVVTGLLRRARFDAIAERSGFSGFLHDAGFHADASAIVGSIVYWFVLLITLVVAFDNLGLPAVSAILNQFVLWLPNLLVALVVLVLAGLVANFVAGLVRGSVAESGFGNPDLFASLAKAAIWVFAIVIAANQIGIATTVVDTLFIGFVAALTLALGLAFGLGGRETAGLIVRDWYLRGQQAANRVNQVPIAPEAERHVPPEGPRRAA